MDDVQRQIGGLSRMVETQLAAHVTENDRRFRVIDHRFDGTNGKIDALATAFGDHERDATDGGTRRGGRPAAAAVGAGATGGILAVWHFIQNFIHGPNQGGS